MSKILGREDILNVDDRKPVEVDVPEWGGTVLVRPLSGDERDKWEQDITKRNRDGTRELDFRGARALLCSRTIVDSNGNRIFTREDVKALGQKSAAALDRVFAAARDGSGISDSDMEELTEDFDEAAGEPSYSG